MPEQQKKLFLLDAMALIYRAHFAFIRTPRINSKGQNTSAIYGFVTSLLEILNKEKPTHLGIVYDMDTPTFRHTQYTEYKANRQSQPEDIRIAIPYIHRIADALCIPNLMADGYEADDVIGTVATQAAKKGFNVYMMTPDKDFGQLVSDHIFQYKPSYMGKPAEVMGVKEICERWEVQEPKQVIDILGLMGDSIDNIPGLPGVGEKTAKKLIHDWGTVENMIANKDKLTGKLRETVEQFAGQAIMSKELATIHCEAPVEFDEIGLTVCEPDLERLRAVFNELEFRALGRRFFEEEAEKAAETAEPGKPKAAAGQLGLFDTAEETINAIPSDLRSIKDVPHDYRFINTPEDRQNLIEYLKTQKRVSFDTETSNLNPHDCNIVGFSFSVKPGEGFYVAANGDEEQDIALLKEFSEIFTSPGIEKVGQNIKYDLIVLKNHKQDLQGPLFDTMLAHYLIEPDMRHGLDMLSQKYLLYSPIPIESLIGKGKKQLSMADLEPEKITDYAAEDADVALQLSEILDKELTDVNARKLFREVETPLVPVLADMEREGVRIDMNALQAYSKQLHQEMLEVETQVYELAGQTFNINSPMQLGEILFEKLKLDPKAKRTAKSKQYATGEEVLSALAPKHDIAQRILDYRQLQKLKSTYVDALPNLINRRTGRVHTSYNQAVAATGRLSSTDPNLQNIPIRTERGREIRKAFIPRDENHILLSADYSQIELRLIAEISGDEGMIQAFAEKQDIHTATAARIFNVPLEEVTSEMRRRSKMVNFGIIYGISAFGLAQRLGIPRGEASEIIQQYNRQYPRIQEYLQKMIKFARENGYVETLLGRRRYLRDINSSNATTRGYAERNAINAPIQGSAADMIKIAMIRIHEEFERRGLKSKMVLQVHDELVFDALKTEVDEVKAIVIDKMKHALDVKIPIEVEVGTGSNWLEAH